MQPVGHHFDLKALLAQGIDLALIRAGLAAQHQQNFISWCVKCGQTQVYRDLGGAGKSSGHEVQDSDRRCSVSFWLRERV
ncbi:hypothetical protein CTTA_1971 [Comamonas testosteroni]|uniref:Uncharacterized protein n=1 Tax=Comamonas testosteroni TaxID=285 RepID=A0A5A7MBG7_COMTE|nr:hypothetical protein CTTA_1971 [Comamonas testosteroni]